MNKIIAVVVLFLFVFAFAGRVCAADSATKDECMAKCKEAADMLKKDKASGTAEILKKDGKFVWKDTYVFLMDTSGKMLAHPMNAALMEKPNVLEITDKNPDKPKKIFAEFVSMAKDKGEGWVSYMWPKPGEDKPSVKETFVFKVPGTELIVCAGTYK